MDSNDNKFYSRGIVTITDKELIIGNKSYMLSHITSMDMQEKINKNDIKLAKLAAILFGIFGIVCIMSQVWIVSIILLFIAYFLNNLKYKHALQIRPSEMDGNAYEDTNIEYIAEILKNVKIAVKNHQQNMALKNKSLNSITNELEKLVQLKKDGILTEYEFQKQKERILNV